MLSVSLQDVVDMIGINILPGHWPVNDAHILIVWMSL